MITKTKEKKKKIKKGGRSLVGPPRTWSSGGSGGVARRFYEISIAVWGFGGVGGVVGFLLGQAGAKKRWVPLQLMHLAGEISQQFSRDADAPLHEATGQRWSWSLWGRVYRGQATGDLHP